MTSKIKRKEAVYDSAFLHRKRLQGKIGNYGYGVKIGGIRGYAGLKNTALQISEFIPYGFYGYTTYVEPFAGLGRVAKYIKTDFIVLNDKSEFARSQLKKDFPKAIIHDLDFEVIFSMYNTSNTIWLIDPPWVKTEYENGCREQAFIDRTPKEYYDKIFQWLPKLKGLWFLCGKKDNKQLLKSEYFRHTFISKKKIMGSNISTLVISNKPFNRYHQMELLTQ